jgi:hypothetical protein
MECRPLAESSLIFSSRGKRGADSKGGWRERRGVRSVERGKWELNYLGFSLFLSKADFTSYTCLSLPLFFKDLKEGRKEGWMDGWMNVWMCVCVCFCFGSFGPCILEEC